MLTHKYQHWYTKIVGLPDLQLVGIVVAVLLLAGLSVIRPQFFKLLAISTIKKSWRAIKRLVRSRRLASRDGVSIAGEFIPDSACLRQTHITGATGSGKTVLQEQLIFERLAAGYGAMIIDPKGDRALRNRVLDFCRSIGREKHFHFLSASWPKESVRWNPCSLGNASELQSKWFNSGVYREPFYAKACELGLLEAFNSLIDDRPKHFTLDDLVRQLKKQAGDGKQQNTTGLFLDLQAFAKSEWGPVLCMPQGVMDLDRPVISLLDITSRNEILFVDIPTEAKAVQSARVGKLLLQEMMLVSGLRKIHPELKGNRPFAVFVDEFDAFATENFATFLNKGRSSDFMIHIAHQTLSDLDRVSPTFKGQVMGNCNVRFIFRQDDPKDAEEWSKYLGTKHVIKKTF
ncbi:MAG: TraM recognition domain-containing protein, partial [Bdellovibrionota bacterium]